MPTPVDTLRDALFGNPPVAGHKPSREGTLSAFRDIYYRVTGLTTGVVAYETQVELPVVTTADNGTQARVWGDLDSDNNVFWIVVDGVWTVDTDLIDAVAQIVQPLVDITNANVIQTNLDALTSTDNRNQTTEDASNTSDLLAEAYSLYGSIAAVDGAVVAVQTIYNDILAIQALGDDAAAIAARVPKNTDGSDFSQPEAVFSALQFKHELPSAVAFGARQWGREQMITPRGLGATFNGIAVDTAILQQGITELSAQGGGSLKFPRGACKYGPLTVPDNVKIYHEDCETIPDFDTTTSQNLYNVTGIGCTISGLWVEGYAATLATNVAKRLIYGDGCDDILIEDLRAFDLTASDGILGLLNKSVAHIAYLKNCLDPRIDNMKTVNVSGASIFAVGTDGLKMRDINTLDNGWYSVEIGNDNIEFRLLQSKLKNVSVNAGMFGGLLNVMSQFTTVASTTSLAIGTGNKVFTVAAGQTGFIPGRIITARSATGTNYMQGRVVSYSGTTLTLNITDTVGSGTYADWSIGSAFRNDRWGRIEGVDIEGVCNYGSSCRVQSAQKLLMRGCTFKGITGGAIHLIGEPVYNVSLDRRGISEGLAESGPCEDVIFEGINMEAGPGALGNIGYSINNQYMAQRDPHRNIQINGGIIRSLDANNRFRNAVIINGGKAGIEGIIMNGVQASTLTDTTAGRPVGAVTVASANVSGQINGAQIINNQLKDLGTPAASAQCGIYAQREIGDIDLKGNRVENYFFGIRTDAFIWSVSGAHDCEFIGCTTDLVLNTPVTRGVTYGTTTPVLGIGFKRGHVHKQSSVAASASNGWSGQAAGAAVSVTYAPGLSGATVAAGKQMRNTSGLVYGIITAGGGVTADEPVHTTVGQEVTGADGYKYRLLSLTTARWVPDAASGALVALP
jgi:hypothetical protein